MFDVHSSVRKLLQFSAKAGAQEPTFGEMVRTETIVLQPRQGRHVIAPDVSPGYGQDEEGVPLGTAPGVVEGTRIPATP